MSALLTYGKDDLVELSALCVCVYLNTTILIRTERYWSVDVNTVTEHDNALKLNNFVKFIHWTFKWVQSCSIYYWCDYELLFDQLLDDKNFKQ